MEDVFDKLETGLEAFEKLVALSSKLPKYNLADDLDEMYEGEGNQLVKDFIKLGDKFVRNWTHNYGEGVEVECSLGRGIDDKEQEVDSQ